MDNRFKFFSSKQGPAYLINRKKIKDSRGNFERLYCEKEFIKILKYKNIKQINRAFTKKRATIRGMHYQVGANFEDKIVSCLKGRVYDVTIDLRKNSKNFLKWYGKIIDSKSSYSNYVPYGFAHGYQTLTDECEMIYFHTDFYYKNRSKIINCFDPKIGIDWPLKNSLIISKKDKEMKFIDNKFKGI